MSQLSKKATMALTYAMEILHIHNLCLEEKIALEEAVDKADTYIHLLNDLCSPAFRGFEIIDKKTGEKVHQSHYDEFVAGPSGTIYQFVSYKGDRTWQTVKGYEVRLK